MCLDCKKKPRAQVAKRDITVWKHLIEVQTDKFVTSYKECPVAVDNATVYESEIDLYKLPAGDEWRVEKALHSYSHIGPARNEARRYGEALVECVIPAGAVYYVGTFYTAYLSKTRKYRSIASDKLKYVRVIQNYIK